MPKQSELRVEQRREGVLALLRREELAAPLTDGLRELVEQPGRLGGRDL